MNVENSVADVRNNGYQYLSFELLNKMARGYSDLQIQAYGGKKMHVKWALITFCLP